MSKNIIKIKVFSKIILKFGKKLKIVRGIDEMNNGHVKQVSLGSERLKLETKKVSVEDTSSRSISDEFQTVIKSEQK